MKRHLVILLVLGLTLAGCGTAQESTPDTATPATSAAANTGEHNDMDVMFLQMMVSHQEQGLRMAEIATEKASSEDVKTLAAAVVATQSDEVTTMKSWLTGWGKPTTADTDVNLHADHGGLPATTVEEIAALEATEAAKFDTAFLALFTGHQHNAVEMAKRETEQGINPDAKALATRIDESRTAQIQLMLRYSAAAPTS